jgi:hypothetical protein
LRACHPTIRFIKTSALVTREARVDSGLKAIRFFNTIHVDLPVINHGEITMGL